MNMDVCMRMRFGVLALVAGLQSLSPASAATTTANFNGHVKLVNSCAATATALDFGTLPGLILGTETTTSTLTVKCTKNAAYTMSLGAGSGAMSGVTTGTDKVNYTATLATTSGTGTGANQTFTINGALSSQSTPSAQDYSETRTVTITY